MYLEYEYRVRFSYSFSSFESTELSTFNMATLNNLI